MGIKFNFIQKNNISEIVEFERYLIIIVAKIMRLFENVSPPKYKLICVTELYIYFAVRVQLFNTCCEY